MLTDEQRAEPINPDDIRAFLQELDERMKREYKLPGETIESPISAFTRAELRAESARRIREITEALETLNCEALLAAKANGQDYF